MRPAGERVGGDPGAASAAYWRLRRAGFFELAIVMGMSGQGRRILPIAHADRDAWRPLLYLVVSRGKEEPMPVGASGYTSATSVLGSP
jgi:hypothetical protein